MIAFPLVVIDANLFEAHYNIDVDDVEVQEIDRLRVFWRGSKSHGRLITPIDIITIDALKDFVSSRRQETDALLIEASEWIRRIHGAFREQKFSKLAIKRAPRGFTGLPSLLRELYRLEQIAEKPPKLPE